MRFTSVTFACVLALLLSKFSLGQAELLPAPQLLSVFPLGAQAGSTCEVRVTGEHLDAASDLVFSNSAIVGTPKLDSSGQAIRNVFLVEVPAHVRHAAYDVRLRGKFGISNPRRFIVGTQPEVTLEKVNPERQKAAEMEVGQVVNAAAKANTQAWFRFKAASRDKLFIRLDAPESRLEPVVTVTDSQGRSLVRGRGVPVIIDFVPPEPNEYWLQVHDLLFRGGDEFPFRLSVSSQPVDPQESAVVPLFATPLSADERTRFTKQSELNGSVRAHDRVLRCPEEHVSLFPRAGQADTFVFDAQAEQEYWIDIWSHRLGYPSDVALTIERLERAEDGSEKTVFVAEADDLLYSPSAIGFGLDSLDGTIRLVTPRNGTYRVAVRDLFNAGPASPRLPYRLSLRFAQPDFQLVAVPDQGPRARPIPSSVYLAPPTLRRGGIASVRVFAQRQDGFAGDIVLSATGLPTGVTCLGAIVGHGDECAALTFYAAEDAPPWSGLIEVQGTAIIDGREVKHTARSGSAIWSVKDTRQDVFRACNTDGIGLAVLAEEAPVLLEPQLKEVIEAKATDKITIPIRVIRRGGYDAIVSLRPFVLGDQDKSARSDHSIPAGAKELSIQLDLSTFSVQPGEHTFVFHGNADKVSYRKNVEWVAPATEDLKHADEELTASRALIDQLKPMVDTLKKELEGAQKKLKAAPADLRAALSLMLKKTEEQLKESDAAFKAAQDRFQGLAKVKAEAEKQLKEIEKGAAPKDMSFVVFSKPIHLRILPNSEKK